MSSLYQKARFLLSVADLHQLPPDQGYEVAIVGRSNAGKSSVLNCLTHQKNLARVSKTPGRTQHINVFVLDEKRRLMDLPGYGFAKVPLAVKVKWQKTVNSYLTTRQSLQGLVVVMDIRHPCKDTDIQLVEFAQEHGLATHVLLNKSDKLSKGAQLKTLKDVKTILTDFGDSVTVQGFSALKGVGSKELQHVLNQWYQDPEKE